ncbi:hypothetical protein [Leptospirillum ferriphilum]|uniref:hypothetical protein n=1 Tax=Leptospirillum ferriphilum TaxID=178606 RepID=UPI000A64D425|nr:hypothetical protein [Leptospirillum ferriphilum]
MREKPKRGSLASRCRAGVLGGWILLAGLCPFVSRVWADPAAMSPSGEGLR